MKSSFCKISSLFAILACASLFPMMIKAQNATPDPATAAIAASPAFQDFLNTLRDALNTQDSEKLKTCIHPKSVVILEADPRTPAKFAKRFANPIPAQCNVSIQPISPTAALPFADKGVVFPVRPSHQIQINFTSENGQPTALVLFLVQDKGKWYEVVPSTPQGK